MEQSEKKIILYGAGAFGRYMGLELAIRGFSIACFCDKNEEKCGRNFCGFPVKSIDEVKRDYPKDSYGILLTMTKNSADKIQKELLEENIFEENDFYDRQSDPWKIMPLFLSFSMDWSALADCVKEQDRWMERSWRELSEEGEALVRESLLLNYYHRDSLEDASYEVKEDFFVQMYGRLNSDRTLVVPWLNSIQKLEGASVLEIGCGTGISTVALCEQGAEVTAIDVDDDSMKVASDRLDAYGVNADILHINASMLLEELPGRRFDFIIFFASLEHMTYKERIQSIRVAFQMLNDDGHVVFVEIPNRLWYFDRHTSKEPFYNWLPDELAMEYATYTSREDFNKGFKAEYESDALRFARWGRGVSYHEFEIALGGAGAHPCGEQFKFLSGSAL